MKYRLYVAEFFATFQLVLIGTGSIVIAQETGYFGDLGIGIAFGLAVYLGVMLFARISGAHMNPAVTVFAYLMKEIKLSTMVYLLITQLTAALSASLVVRQFATSKYSTLGTTEAHIGVASTWGLEFLLTFILVATILFVYKKSYLVIALSAGTIVFLEAWLAGPFTGASMNPARSLGPAVISGHLENLWIYLTAPVAASLVVVWWSKLIFRKR